MRAVVRKFRDAARLMNNPAVAAITAEGTLLVLESGNNRIYALDISGILAVLHLFRIRQYDGEVPLQRC